MHVYMIQNKVNGKVYIGQHAGKSISQYFSKTFYKAVSGDTGKPRLYNAIRKYGRDNFDTRIIYNATSPEDLDNAEIAFIRFFGSQNKELGYNVSGGGKFGQGVSEETKEKLRIANIGKKASEETRAKMSVSQKGRVFSEETKKKLSDSQKGKPRKPISEETKLKMSITHTGVPCGPCSDDTKKKISAANKGRTLTEEWKQKIGESLKNRVVSDYTKEKMKAAWARRKGVNIAEDKI